MLERRSTRDSVELDPQFDGCGRRVQGRHPLQTSDALGAAAVQLGPDAVATAAVLNKQLGLSFRKLPL